MDKEKKVKCDSCRKTFKETELFSGGSDHEITAPNKDDLYQTIGYKTLDDLNRCFGCYEDYTTQVDEDFINGMSKKQRKEAEEYYKETVKYHN